METKRPTANDAAEHLYRGGYDWRRALPLAGLNVVRLVVIRLTGYPIIIPLRPSLVGT